MDIIKKRHVFQCLLCLFVLLSSCTAALGTAEPNNTTAHVIPLTVASGTVTLNTDARMTLVVENADVHTYVDTFLRIAMDFLKDWRFEIDSSDKDSISAFYSPCQSLAPDIHAPCTKMLVLWQEETYLNLKELREHVANESSPYPLESQQIDEIEIAEYPALRVKSIYNEGGNEKETLRFYILKEEGFILINGYGALDPVDDVVSTIRALEEK